MLMVDTQADNTPAIKFFKRKGFENPTKHVYLTLNLQKEG
jgi:ribosomal protein S18 acetylase RimI-like enzyme